MENGILPQGVALGWRNACSFGAEQKTDTQFLAIISRPPCIYTLVHFPALSLAEGPGRVKEKFESRVGTYVHIRS
jgi:hypothetical protein